MTVRPSDAPVRRPGTRTRSGNAMGRTRAALLQAAAACIEEHGVRPTTMVEVSSRSGVAKATLYNHFRTKQDLLVALVEAFVAEVVATATATATEAGPVPALAGAAVWLSSHGPLRTAALREPAALAPLLTPSVGRGWQAATDGVRAALAAGHVDATVDQVDLVLRWLVSHVMWPVSTEGATSAATDLVRGLSRADEPAAAVGRASEVPPATGTAGAPAAVGWPS